MDLLRREDLSPLLETSGGTCISIYIPTDRAGVATLQNPIRFKNRVRDAERRLNELAVRPAEAKEILAPLKALVEDHDFWQRQEDALAIFRSAGRFTQVRLPLAVEEMVAVGERFHLRPLLRIVAQGGRFWVLATSRTSVRLLDCTRYTAREAALPESVPRTLAAVVAATDVESHAQVRRSGQRTEGGRAGLVYGHGGAAEENGKEDMARFFREVDRGLRAVLKEGHAPLVFAGQDFPVYRAVNTYPHLAAEGVALNVEGMRPAEIRQRALAVAEPLLAKALEKAAAEYTQRLASGRASDDLGAIAEAARHSRVDCLFFAEDAPAPQSLAGEDLLDLAAVETMLHGGAVYPVERERVPGGKTAAAVFRY